MDTKNDLNYTALRKVVNGKIYGTWDDHDYGLDDAGKNNPIQNDTRPMFLDFIDEPKDSERWTRPDGIYGSWYLDELKKIKLILVDGRSNMDEEDE